MGVGSGDADTKMGDSEDGIEKGSTHEDFKEFEELRGLVSGLQNVYKDQNALEMSCERITCKFSLGFFVLSFFMWYMYL